MPCNLFYTPFLSYTPFRLWSRAHSQPIYMTTEQKRFDSIIDKQNYERICVTYIPLAHHRRCYWRIIHDCMPNWSWKINTLTFWRIISRLGPIDASNFVGIPFLDMWVWIEFYDVYPFFPYANLSIQSFLPNRLRDSVLIRFIRLNTRSSFTLVNGVISNNSMTYKTFLHSLLTLSFVKILFQTSR